MSDNTAGGPPPDETEPTPQNPYASTPDPDAAPPPSEPVQPVTPPVTPPAQPTHRIAIAARMATGSRW